MRVPYISFVVTSRNDDHGGGMLRRMQIFVDALHAQAERHRLSCELILVEWNPPGDRPGLEKALRWPNSGGYCKVRIVRVPAELHGKIPNSDRQNLFQMIAKNAGIRRAHGEFILLTNVDIIFSDELFSFLASQSLAKGLTYRSDRVDVDSDVPLDASIEEQLDFCRNHVLRVCRRDGTWSVPRSSERTVENAVPEKLPLVTRKLRGFARPWKEKIGAHRWESFLWKRVASRVLEVVVYSWKASREAVRIAKQSGTRPDMAVWFDDIMIAFRRPPHLHTNACGDFTLIDKESWLRIRGNPEFPMYSMHLDSLAIYQAHFSGAPVHELPAQMVHFHIEHGSGWTPEAHISLYAGFKKRGLPILHYGGLMKYAHALKKGKIRYFNDPDWGFASSDFIEIHP